MCRKQNNNIPASKTKSQQLTDIRNTGAAEIRTQHGPEGSDVF